MFFILLNKEIRNHLQTFRFAAALLTTFLLIVVSVWVLGNDFIKQRDTYNRLAEQYAREAKDVYIPSRINPTLLNPPTPLSIFAQGESKQLGNTVNISRWQVPAHASDTLSNNWLISAMPSFDLLAIFTLVISVFGILLSYDGFCGERENGSLKLLCTFPPSRGLLFTTKFVASTIVLAIPFMLSFLSSLLILQFVHNLTFTAEQWLAIGMMLFPGLLFGTLFIGIGLLCSTLVARSSTSLVLSLLIWSLGVLLIPSIASSASTAIHPSLPREEIDKFAQESRREILIEQNQFRNEKTPRASWGWGCWNIGGESPFLFEGSDAQSWDHTQKYVRFYEPLWQQRADDIYKLEKKHMDEKKQQAEIAETLSSFAPASHLRKAFTALAGTNFNSYEKFMNNTRKYRSSMLDIFRAKGYFTDNVIKLFSRRDKEDVDTDEKVAARIESYRTKIREGMPIWDLISPATYWEPLPADLTPAFDFNGGKPDINAAIWPMSFLALITAVVFLLGFIAFTRYDVR